MRRALVGAEAPKGRPPQKTPPRGISPRPGACAGGARASPGFAGPSTRVARVMETHPRAAISPPGRVASGVIAARPRMDRAVGQTTMVAAPVGEGAGRRAWPNPPTRANVGQAGWPGRRVHKDLASVIAETPDGRGAVARGRVTSLRRAPPDGRAAVEIVPEESVRIRGAKTRPVGVPAPDA